MRFGVLFQLPAQFPRQENRPQLTFNAISARPACTASTVMYFTSLTRIPVAQMVSSSRASRSRPRVWAAVTSRPYSSRVSSRRSSPEDFSLNLYRLNPIYFPTGMPEKLVDCGHHGIYTRGA